MPQLMPVMTSRSSTATAMAPVPALLVSDIFPPKVGGSGRWFWEIYRRLPRDQYFIAAGQDPRETDFDRSHDLNVVARLPLEFRDRGIRSFRSLKMYLSAANKISKLVRRHRIRRLHCARCLPEGLIGRLVKFTIGTPYLCFVHGEEISIAQTSRELTWLARRVFASADFLIANSQSTRSLLLDQWGIAPERIRLLHPGVDTKRFVPAPRNQSLRDELGWGDHRVVVTVGRLQKRKGHDMLIRSFPAVIREIPDLLYAIVGDGEEATGLRQLAMDLGVADHVQFLGEVDDARLLECYQQCELFALPNRVVGKDIEGFGMVLLEAQACGKPVLAGASGGTAETMRIPETGRVVPCEEPGKLAAALIELLGDRNRLFEMGERGRAWVCERFDWSVLGTEARRLFEAPRA